MSKTFSPAAEESSVTLTAAKANCREKALKGLNDLPPFSPILNRLLASLANEDISFAKLAQLIEKDTVLAGNVLRMVNSALYGCRGTINSVSHAIAIMGLVKLRNTALGFSVSRMWKNLRSPRGWSSARFNLHSVAAAILTDLLAQRVPVNYPEGAFVSGLFHDLGKMLIATALPEEYDQIHQMIQVGKVSETESELEVLGFTHAELSAEALGKWNLPRPIQQAVGFHHRPSEAPSELRGEYQFHLADLLLAADEVVNSMGITIAPPAAGNSEPDFTALTPFAPSVEAPRIIEDFHSEYDVIRGLF